MVYRLVISSPVQGQDRLSLNGEQVHYLRRVLRLQDGDRLIAMDGQGQAWFAVLNEDEIVLGEALAEATELKVAVTLLIALPKGNGFEEIIRPCTELGVTRFIPVISDRSLLKPSGHKWERWQKIVREAAEQCERQWVPEILQPQPFTQALANLKHSEHSYLCVTRLECPHLCSCLSSQSQEPLLIAIGPEGGWTEAEIASAIAVGMQPVSLGKRILRAVTAPTVAMSLVATWAELERS